MRAPVNTRSSQSVRSTRDARGNGNASETSALSKSAVSTSHAGEPLPQILDGVKERLDAAIGRVRKLTATVQQTNLRLLGSTAEGDESTGHLAAPAPTGVVYEIQDQLVTLHSALSVLEGEVNRTTEA